MPVHFRLHRGTFLMRRVAAGLVAIAYATSAFSQGVVPTVNTSDTTNANSGAVTVSVTPAAGLHAAGAALGGLITIPIARIDGGGGTVMSVLLTEGWAGTNPVQVRLWQKLPAATTCTDNVAFAANATDDLSLIGSGWFTLTPAAPLSAVGDTKTYASLTGIAFNFKNTDTSSSKNLYACLQATATGETPAGSALTFSLAGPTN